MTEYEHPAAAEAYAEVLARPATAADVLDGGAGLRERARAAAEIAEAKAEAHIAAQRDAERELRAAEKAYLTIRPKAVEAITNAASALSALAESRVAYKSAHGKAVDLEIQRSLVPRLAVEQMNDRELRLTVQKLDRLLKADL